jgi:hypothetical protein
MGMLRGVLLNPVRVRSFRLRDWHEDGNEWLKLLEGITEKHGSPRCVWPKGCACTGGSQYDPLNRIIH